MINIDEIMDKPCWVMDILPKRVPQDAGGQYFAVERYYLDRIDLLCGKYAQMLLKLNCYYDIAVSHDGEKWKRNPDPEDMEQWIGACLSTAPTHPSLFILVKQENTLMVVQRDSTHITIYNPSEALLELLRQLAKAEGLFVWKGIN